jgi:hypothetical protein
MSYLLGCDAVYFGRQLTDVSDERAASIFSLDDNNHGHRCESLEFRVTSFLCQRLMYKKRSIIVAVWSGASAY